MASVSISANGAMSAPYLYSTATVSEKSRNGTSVVLDVKIVSHLKYPESYLGNGYTITGTVTAYGISKSFTLKESSSNWNGDGDHTKTGTMTITVPTSTTSITIGYKCKVDGLYGTTKTGTSKSLTLSKVLANVTSATDFTDTTNPIVYFTNPNNSKVRPWLDFYDKQNGTLLLTLFAPTSSIPQTGALLNTSYNWDLDEEYSEGITYRDKIRNVLGARNNAYVVVGLTTYIDTTRIGTTGKGVNFTNELSPPTFNYFTFEDVNEKTLNLTGNNSQKLIGGYSTLLIDISDTNKAIANKGATMSHYLINGVKYTYSENFKQEIANWNKTSIEVFAVDSRGLSTQLVLPCELIAYTPLQKGNSLAKRQGGVNEEITLLFEGNIWNNWFGGEENIGIKNSIKNVKYEYWIGTNEPTQGEQNIIPVVVENTFKYENVLKGDTSKGFLTNNSYNIKVIVEDELSFVEYTVRLPSGIPAIAMYKNNVSLHGKYDTELGGSQIYGDLFLNSEKIVEPNIICGCLSSEMTAPTNTTTFAIPIDELVAQIGNKLSIGTTPAGTKCIKIGTGIKKVLVSGNIQFNNTNNSSSTYYVGYIYRMREGETSVLVSRSISNRVEAGDASSVSMTNKPIEVQEGDLLIFNGYKTSSTGNATIGQAERTYMTVQAIG